MIMGRDNLGRAVPLDNFFVGAANTAHSLLPRLAPTNANLQYFELSHVLRRFPFMLASQWELLLRGLLGADRRVRRCSSLGGQTPAGACVPK